MYYLLSRFSHLLHCLGLTAADAIGYTADACDGTNIVGLH
jgi:hypothetical protein